MHLFDLFRINMPGYQYESNVEQDDIVSKWRKTNLYRDFLSKIELQIEIHVDNIKKKTNILMILVVRKICTALILRRDIVGCEL